jgi:hypothetical protein
LGTPSDTVGILSSVCACDSNIPFKVVNNSRRVVFNSTCDVAVEDESLSTAGPGSLHDGHPVGVELWPGLDGEEQIARIYVRRLSK